MFLLLAMLILLAGLTFKGQLNRLSLENWMCYNIYIVLYCMYSNSMCSVCTVVVCMCMQYSCSWSKWYSCCGSEKRPAYILHIYTHTKKQFKGSSCSHGISTIPSYIENEWLFCIQVSSHSLKIFSLSLITKITNNKRI